MKSEVKLYLCGHEVDFASTPDILYNYTLTDLENPSAVKNSYTKTITLNGTKANNKIFGEIFDVQRVSGGLDGTYYGADFNPLKKADFSLYVDGNVYESGYFKLDEIRKTGNTIEYDVTLYGGFGDFVYNLATREDGSKRELSDLIYKDDDGNDADLTFRINKGEIDAAWHYGRSVLGSGYYPRPRHSVINFAPTLDGIPKDFEANKAIVYKASQGPTKMTFGSNNVNLVNLREEVTGAEIKDCRSYLQRPVLRVKKVLEACFDERQNGGFKVIPDHKFFNQSNEYFEKSWMTLPMLRDYDNENTLALDVNITDVTNKSNCGYSIDFITTNVFDRFSIKLCPYITANTSSNSLYLNKFQDAYTNRYSIRNPIQTYVGINSTIAMQVIAYNAAGEVIGSSNSVYLSSKKPERSSENEKIYNEAVRDTTWGMMNPADNTFSNWCVEAEEPYYEMSEGFFKKNSDGGFYWSDNNGNRKDVTFTLKADGPIVRLEFKFSARTSYKQKLFVGSGAIEGFNNNTAYVYTTQKSKLDTSRIYELDEILRNDLVSISTNSLFTKYSEYSADASNSTPLYSGTKFTQNDLLSLGVSPADFLLSYCKLFNLLLWKETDSKTIHIDTRATFYEDNKTINIEDIIDRSKPIKITPQVAKVKWYDLSLDVIDSESNKEYRNTYGRDYGIQRLNTGSDFNTDKENLFKDNIFSIASDVMENDKYFFEREDCVEPPVMLMDSYIYYNNNEKHEMPNPYNVIESSPINKRYKGYDIFARPQMHDKNNESVDGAFALLFFDGYQYTNYTDNGRVVNVEYNITDDTLVMVSLSEGPCWYGGLQEQDSEHILDVITTNYLPKFVRNIVRNDVVVRSWDLGKPQIVYSPNVGYNDTAAIYPQFWKNYTNDLYNVDSRILKCHILPQSGSINISSLRDFYWFDNAIWRLNSIKDYNITIDRGTVEVEFVKVQDANNYTQLNFRPISDYFDISMVETDALRLSGLNKYVAGPNNTKYDIKIDTNINSNWNLDSYITAIWEDGTSQSYLSRSVADRTAGSGSNVIHITLPVNEKKFARTITFHMTINNPNILERQIVVEQEKAIIYEFSVSPTGLYFTNEGGTKTLNLTYDPKPDNDVVRVTVTSGNDWLSIGEINWNGVNGTLNVTAQPNRDRVGKTAVLQFSSSDSVWTSFEMYVSQDMVDYIDVTNTLYYAEISGGGTVPANTISSNATEEFKVIIDASDMWSVQSYPYWVLPDWEGGGEWYFTTEENDSMEAREGDIVFSLLDKPEVTGSIHIIQNGQEPYLRFGRLFKEWPQPHEVFEFDESRAIYYFEIQTNMGSDYLLSHHMDIYIVEQTDTYLRFSVPENNTYDIKYYTFIISKDGQGDYKVIEQLSLVFEPHIEVSEPVNDENGKIVTNYPGMSKITTTYTINVDANMPWDIDLNNTHFITEVSRTDTSFTYRVHSNDSSTPRLVDIMFYLPDEPSYVALCSIGQDGGRTVVGSPEAYVDIVNNTGYANLVLTGYAFNQRGGSTPSTEDMVIITNVTLPRGVDFVLNADPIDLNLFIPDFETSKAVNCFIELALPNGTSLGWRKETLFSINNEYHFGFNLQS